MSLHSSIRELLGDAPDQARQADAREANSAPGQTTTGGTMEANQLDRQPDEPTSGVSGVSSEPGLSTADVASASAAPVETEDRPAQADTTDQPLGGASDDGQPTEVPATDRQPQAMTASPSAPASQAVSASESDGGPPAQLFPTSDAQSFRGRWTDVQAEFVDDPRQAVKQADGLVAEVVQRLAQSFADERSSLERQWDQGGDVSTEDLRQALRRYRSFFDRLLSL